TLDAISPIVAITKANFSATYEPVAFPFEIRGGRINYAQKIIRLENAQGSVGRSTFEGLGVILHYDGSRQIKVDSGQASLDLQQTDTLLRSFKDLRSYLTEFQSARGQIELQKLTLTGAYDEPASWTFASTGNFNHVEIQHANLPDRMILSRGKFAADQGRIIFSETAATLSDASLITGGTLEYKQGEPIQFETSGMGTIGARMTQWVSRYVDLPDEFHLRSPVKIAVRRLAWRAGGDISFQGQVNVADGPQLTVDAVKRPQGLALQNLTIDDGDRRARMTLHLAKENLDLSFTGELTQPTIDKLFTSFPTKGSSLRGELQVSAVLGNPIRVTGRGQLSGSNLLIPLGADKGLIEKFSIEAEGESVMVRSVDLRWGQSHLTASGKITGAKEMLRVELDVTGDRLDWEQLQRSFGGESKQPQQKKAGVMSIPDVQGTIRLKADSFTFERFNMSPLETTIAISGSGIRTEINRAVVCGINTTGRFDAADKDISLDLHLSARDAELEPATLCLTNQQSDITGTYSLTARVTGRGNREHLRSALKGDFQFSARDGEFVRSAGVDATFDYLNRTGDFAVEFPDLNKQAFPYRLLSAKGTIDGESLFSDEVIIQGSPLTVTGQGSVNLQRRQVDLKGLVSVALPAGQVIKRIPIIGAIVGGSLVGIPVRVRGSLDRPEVSYLSAGDVGAELLNLPLRILGAPLDAIRLFTPSGENRDKNITQ
ncbi:MAG TPA: AsmA-like C-terminal domain-containing protein, partial [Methylomirabilota bacterium]|nr:AsmA-like C-terminal domain-containing protein [Methylomirabilota bacterium]